MLQITQLRDNAEQITEALKKRGLEVGAQIEEIIALDEKRRKNQVELDQTLAKSNALSKEIGQLYREKKIAEAEEKKQRTSQLKERSKVLQEEQEQFKGALEEKLVELPNVPHPSVPAGHSEADNEEVKRSEKAVELAEGAVPHWELADRHQLISFDLGVKITGAGFPVYRGKGAQLQRALINFFLAENTKAGYEEFIPPHFVNADSAYGTGQLPDKEGQMYHIEKDGLYAIPTAEVPVTNIFRNEVLKEEDLPLKCTAYTPCFRREAGSYGKEVRGLNRLHQFDKVEIVQLTKPEDSYSTLDQMVAHVEGLLQKLELPYRILRLCGGDLGFTSALTYDFEVWSAAQERWLEVSSVSNFETFQANRMKIRYRGSDKKTHLCHSLNGSALALPRIMAALLENHQQGNVINMPSALHPFLPFEKIAP